MRIWKLCGIAVVGAGTLVQPAASQGRSLVVPFDFSRSEIVVEVNVSGTALHMLLDTGFNPSGIDILRARALGLKIDYAGGGEVSGTGDAKSAVGHPTSLNDVALGGRHYGSVGALTLDMKPISDAMGRPIDGVLGRNFLEGKLSLIDYAAHTVTFFDERVDAALEVNKCHSEWRSPVKSFPGGPEPILEMKIGGSAIPVSIDTGRSDALEVFQKALDIPAIKDALVEAGTTKTVGARGTAALGEYRLEVPISLGPFTLPAGQAVDLSSVQGSPTTRLGNAGNRLFASMQVRLLLDYQRNELSLLGDCS